MNIIDVAKTAGVSVATVSRVINNSNRVSQKTRELVLEAIKETGYRSGEISEPSSDRNPRLILVLITSVNNTHYSKIIKGIENIAIKRGYFVVVANCYDNVGYEEAYLPLLTKKMVDGIILAGASFVTSDIVSISKKFPLIQCGEYLTDNVPFVGIDNEKAAYEIVNMMIQSGKRHIALLSVGNLKPSTVSRLKGYLRALRENNLPFDRELVFYSTYGFRSALAVTEPFLIQNPHVDGIFAICDRMAAGAIRAVKNIGKSVPDDIAVGGVDNVEVAYTVEPGLTTVSQNQEQMGRIAAEMLIDLINKKPLESNHVIIPYELVKRESI
ncbi:MAG: LacI family DNA-binding transcriptional regulator [Bacillota bacterium]|nr:LacI family DNA-binding transcriptional regulator [Bacillota bacterium]